jgi:hypothetical protein
MSWTDEEIDKLAQENASNTSFKYKDEYWTEFEAMLPKNGGKNFTWFFSAFLFVGLIGTSLIFNRSFSNDSSELATEQKNDVPVTLASVSSQNSLDQIIDKSNNVETVKTPQNNKTNKTETISNQNSIAKIEKSKKLNTAPQKSVNSTKDFNEISIDPSIISLALGKNQEESMEGDVTEKSEEVIDNAANEIISNEINNTNELNDLADQNIAKLPVLPLKEAVTAELIPMTLHNERDLPAIATFYVGAFGGLSQSLVTPSKDITTSFGLGLGAQIQKGRFTFTTGVNAIWSNHKDLNLTRSAKIYGFGSNQYNYEFKYKQIYTLEAELTAGYKFGRHLLNVGVRPSLIVGTKVGISESIDDKNSIDRNEYGHVNGLNRFGIKPMIGYSFDVTRSLKLGVNIGVEMMPKIQDGFLEGTSNRYSIDGQIYLRHSIKFKR